MKPGIILISALTSSLVGYVAHHLGKIKGKMQANEDHLRWLTDMDNRYGDINPLYRLELQALGDEELPYYPEEDGWLDD